MYLQENVPGEVLYMFYLFYLLRRFDSLFPATDETSVTAVGDKSLITPKMEK